MKTAVAADEPPHRPGLPIITVTGGDASNGACLPPGLTTAVNTTGCTEYVLTSGTWLTMDNGQQ